MFKDVFAANARIHAIACGALIAVFSASAMAATAPDNGPHKVLAFAVANGAVAGVPGNTINVQQGDDVELRWSGDKPMELHLHGYDIEVKVTPQTPAVMSFKANIPGRFSIEQHGQGPGHHPAVLYLEVHP